MSKQMIENFVYVRYVFANVVIIINNKDEIESNKKVIQTIIVISSFSLPS